MLKLIIKSFFISALIISSVFADDDSQSAFHQQEVNGYSAPIGEASYYATLAPMPSKSSGYFGLNLGAFMMPINSKIEVNGSSGTQKKDVIGFNAGIYDGYGVNFNHFYIGGELGLGGNLLSKKLTNTVNGVNTDLTIKQPVVASLDLIPGFTNYQRTVLFYGRLGVSSSLFRVDFSDTTNNLTDDSNKIVFGMRAGLGMEYFFNDTFSLRTEYIYTRNNKFNTTFTSANTTNQYVYGLDATSSHLISLGLSIHY